MLFQRKYVSDTSSVTDRVEDTDKRNSKLISLDGVDQEAKNRLRQDLSYSGNEILQEQIIGTSSTDQQVG